MKTAFIRSEFESTCKKRFQSDNYSIYVDRDGKLNDEEFVQHLKESYRDMAQFIDLYINLYSCSNMREQLLCIAWSELEVYREKKRVGEI